MTWLRPNGCPTISKPIVKEETSTKVFQVWDTWLGFGLMAALLIGEWFFRKMINLP